MERKKNESSYDLFHHSFQKSTCKILKLNITFPSGSKTSLILWMAASMPSLVPVMVNSLTSSLVKGREIFVAVPDSNKSVRKSTIHANGALYITCTPSMPHPKMYHHGLRISRKPCTVNTCGKKTKNVDAKLIYRGNTICHFH